MSTITVPAKKLPAAGEPSSPAITVLFALTLFLSAFLLFQVQLIVSKYILPWFGGTAAVWTTSMLVFQLLLLAGYLYSHVISARLSSRMQAWLHLGLLTGALLLVVTLSFLWPSAVTPGLLWKPRDSSTPVRDVTTVLLASAGLPFFVLSTTGPLLQRWFAGLGGGAKTYKLYSVSNLGSLLGLLLFPSLIETTLRVKEQGTLWSLLFFAFATGCAVCAWKARKATDEPAVEENPSETTNEIRAGLLMFGLWFLLAACASSLLLAITNVLCQEVMSVPLLWVLPLSLYLLSFILCFDHPRWYRRAVIHPLFAVTLFAACAALVFNVHKAQAIALPLLLFLTCMICHGELYRLKPQVQQLTWFYLTIAAGGAAGGVFVGIVAPHLFTSFVEFQISIGAGIMLLLVCLLLDGKSWIFGRHVAVPGAIIGCVLIAGYAGGLLHPKVAEALQALRFYPITLLIGMLAGLGAFLRMDGNSEKRGFRFVQVPVGCLAIFALLMLYQTSRASPQLIMSTRNFYGALRVMRSGYGKVLMHGGTIHGAQNDPPWQKQPSTYYGPNSGVGVVIRNHPKRGFRPGTLRIGLVGLGVGTLLTYGLPGDYFRIYELNPDVVQLSSGPQPMFTFARDSAAGKEFLLGDGRLLLEREAGRGEFQNFDLLVLDAFSGDAVPVHLLTREAFETYWKHMNPQSGIIAVHISTAHVDLLPVVRGIIKHYQADSVVRTTAGKDPYLPSIWVLLSRSPGALKVQGLEEMFPPDRKPVAPRLWTDDYNNIVGLLR